MNKAKKKSKKSKSKKSKKPQSKKVHQKAKPRISRIQASAIYLKDLKGKVSIDEAVAGCDAAYVKAGSGVSNLREARYSFNKAFEVMRELKVLKIDEDGISLIK